MRKNSEVVNKQRCINIRIWGTFADLGMEIHDGGGCGSGEHLLIENFLETENGNEKLFQGSDTPEKMRIYTEDILIYWKK